jgi:uncharacterized protein
MRRLLIFIAALYVVWRILGMIGKRVRRETGGSDAFSRFSARRKSRSLEGDEPLVACARCGIHVPSSRTVRGESGFYCSTECRQLAEAAHAPVARD